MICPECGKECSVKRIDEGIGPYEFWGQKCCQQVWVYVSDCCEAELDDGRSEWDDERAEAKEAALEQRRELYQ